MDQLDPVAVRILNMTAANFRDATVTPATFSRAINPS